MQCNPHAKCIPTAVQPFKHNVLCRIPLKQHLTLALHRQQQPDPSPGAHNHSSRHHPTVYAAINGTTNISASEITILVKESTDHLSLAAIVRDHQRVLNFIHAAAAFTHAAQLAQQLILGNQQLLQQQRMLQDQLQQVTADRDSLAQQMQQAHQQAVAMQEQLQGAVKQQQEAQSKLSASDDNAKKLQSKISALQSEHQKAERQSADQIKQLQEALNIARSRIEAAQEAAEKRVADVQAAAAKEVEEHRRKWRDEFEKRRKLHNIVIEMKGNIRVLARIRPMIEKEFASSGGGTEAQAVRMIDEERVAVMGVTSKEFEFDKAFGPADGQEQVNITMSGVMG
eukprot:GHUV01019749.1.p1 GENE.GHUV01019749.1~~GHUV01019749.1.p1  ORF type:complete len:341 (+),score=125.63 GHUV01019749.1:597-1619(+)